MAKKFTVGAATREKKYGYFGFKPDGEDFWINIKKPVQRGDKVEVSYKKGKGGRLYATNLKVLSSGGGSSNGRGGSSNGDEINWNASVARAIEAATLLLAHDAHVVGAKSKPADRKTSIVGLIDELTVKFFKDIKSRKPLKAEEEVDEDLEESDDEDGDEDEADSDDDADESDDSDDDDDVFEDD